MSYLFIYLFIYLPCCHLNLPSLTKFFARQFLLKPLPLPCVFLRLSNTNKQKKYQKQHLYVVSPRNSRLWLYDALSGTDSTKKNEIHTKRCRCLGAKKVIEVRRKKHDVFGLWSLDARLDDYLVTSTVVMACMYHSLGLRTCVQFALDPTKK
jgi:hypothetical protein